MIQQQTLQKIPLLLVIKHDLFRETFGFALCQEDPAFEIAGQCGNSRKAMEIFAASSAKIIIMDASIRPISFAESALDLQCFDKDIRIIAMTNHYDQRRADRLVNQGAAGLITRDMTLGSMIAILRNIAKISERTLY